MGLQLCNLLVLSEQLLVLQGQLFLQRGHLLSQLGQHYHMVAAGRVQEPTGLRSTPQRSAPVGQLGCRVQTRPFTDPMLTANLVVGERGRRVRVLAVVVVVLAGRGGSSVGSAPTGA